MGKRSNVQVISNNVQMTFPQSPVGDCGRNNNFITDLHRSCTDVICCLLFAAFVAAWIVVAVFCKNCSNNFSHLRNLPMTSRYCKIFVFLVAYMWGDPQKLIFPTDSLGQICGVTTLYYNLRYRTL